MAARTVEGPKKDWLDMADLIKVMRMSESTILRLIAAGEFPEPLQTSPGIKMWSWRDVVYWNLRVETRPRLAQPTPSPPASGRGHRPSQPGHLPSTETPAD